MIFTLQTLVPTFTGSADYNNNLSDYSGEAEDIMIRIISSSHTSIYLYKNLNCKLLTVIDSDQTIPSSLSYETVPKRIIMKIKYKRGSYEHFSFLSHKAAYRDRNMQV